MQKPCFFFCAIFTKFQKLKKSFKKSGYFALALLLHMEGLFFKPSDKTTEYAGTEDFISDDSRTRGTRRNR